MTEEYLRKWYEIYFGKTPTNSELLAFALYYPDLIKTTTKLLNIANLKIKQGKYLKGKPTRKKSFYEDVVNAPEQLDFIFNYLLDPVLDFIVKKINPNDDPLKYLKALVLDNGKNKYSRNLKIIEGDKDLKNAFTILHNAPLKWADFLKEICDNVYKDRNVIGKLFFEGEIVKLNSITHNKGDELHRGGKHVVKLGFMLKGDKEERTLIYKPSSIEADCLIAGDTSGFVHAKVKGFPLSFCEMINKEIEDAKNEDVLRFPTYKILPITYKDIKKSYGYIEFLGADIPLVKNRNEVTDGMFMHRVVDPNDEKDIDKIKDFYRVYGQQFALASLLSIEDLHSENIIVHNFMPCLIDMENCFVNGTHDAESTGLDDSLNGKGKKSKNLLINSKNQEIEYYNYRSEIFRGFNSVLDLFEGLVEKKNDVRLWLKYLLKGKGVVVRCLPYITKVLDCKVDYGGHLTGILRQYFEGGFERTFLTKREMLECKNLLVYEDYKNWKKSRASQYPEQPKFLVLQDKFLNFECADFCVPVYCHRIGTKDLLASNGDKITFPKKMIVAYNDKAAKAFPTIGFVALSDYVNRQYFYPDTPIKLMSFYKLIMDSDENSFKEWLGKCRPTLEDLLLPVDLEENDLSHMWEKTETDEKPIKKLKKSGKKMEVESL